MPASQIAASCYYIKHANPQPGINSLRVPRAPAPCKPARATPNATRRAQPAARASAKRRIVTTRAASSSGWAEPGQSARTATTETDADEVDVPLATPEWVARLERLLPKKDDPICDGDMCDLQFRSKGTVMGAAFLIAGCSLGGGMLAVPAAAIGAGFAPTMAAMVCVWGFLLLQGLLLVEVNIAAATWLKRRDASILSMARLTLGQSMGTIVAAAYVLLSNATLISQMIRGGSLLDSLVPGLSYVASTVLVAAVGGGMVYFMTSEGLDEANKCLVAVMVASFAALLLSGLNNAVWMRLGRMEWALSVHMTPTMLQVLQYGNLIPVICAYLNLDRKRIKKALLIGSAIPMVMVGLWCGLSFAMIPFGQGLPIGDPTDLLISGSGGALVGAMVSVFAGAAVLTTIIGMLLSLHEFWEGALRSPAELPSDDTADSGVELCLGAPTQEGPLSLMQAGWQHPGMLNLMARVIAVLPALLISVTVSSDAFHEVLSFSGAYLVTILCGLVPPLMVWVTRGNRLPWTKTPWQGPASRPILPGGKWLLGSLFSITVAFMLASLVQDLPLLVKGMMSVLA